MGFDKWKHLILTGEFAERKKILSGLTAEEANKKPAQDMHSIYEELWHANGWMQIVINQDSETDKIWQAGEVYPKSHATGQEWDNKVERVFSVVWIK